MASLKFAANIFDALVYYMRNAFQPTPMLGPLDDVSVEFIWNLCSACFLLFKFNVRFGVGKCVLFSVEFVQFLPPFSSKPVQLVCCAGWDGVFY